MRHLVAIVALVILAAAPARGTSIDPILLVTTQSTSVLEYDALTYAPLGTFASGFSSSQGITVGPDGNVYVSDGNTSNVTRYSRTGASLGVFASGAPLNDPWGITFGPDGNLYVASYGSSGQVERFNGSTGAYMGVFTTGPGNPMGGSGAVDLFFKGGFLYVSDYVNAEIHRYDATTGVWDSTWTAAVPGARILGIAHDAAGNIYGTPYNGYDFIEKFSAAGTDLGSLATSGLLRGPTGILVAANGDLIVGGGVTTTLARFDSAGNYVATIDTGANFAYEAILSTPEPGALALLLAGLGPLAWRRRRAR